METIGALLKSVVDWFWNAVGTMMHRLASEPRLSRRLLCVFRSPAFFGWAFQPHQLGLGAYPQVFSATKAPPAPGAGPSPSGLTGGCVLGALVLLLLAIIAMYMLAQSVFS